MPEPSPRNPPSRRWHFNDNYDLHRGYAYKDAKGRWRSPDGSRWVSARSAKATNDRRIVALRIVDLQTAAAKQGRRLTARQAARSVAAGGKERSKSAREAIIEDAAERYDLDTSDLFDDYFTDETP